jgi:hypothetical protein
MIFDFLVGDLKRADRHSAVADQLVTILVGHCLRPGKRPPLFCACHNGGKVDCLGANTDLRFLIRKWFARKGPFEHAVRASVTSTCAAKHTCGLLRRKRSLLLPPMGPLSLSSVYRPRALAAMSVPTGRGGLGKRPGRSCYRCANTLAYYSFVERQWPTTRLSRVDEFRKGRSWSPPSRERLSLVSTIAFVSAVC